METLVGFAVGFLVGTKEGKEGLAKITEAYEAIRESAQFRSIVSSGIGMALPIVKDLTKAIRA